MAAVEEDDDDTETRVALPRIKNERSRVIEQLSDEAAPVPAIQPLPQVAQASRTPSVPAPLQLPASPPRARRPWGSIALFCAMLGLSVVPLLRYARSHEGPHLAPVALPLGGASAPQPIVTSAVSSAARVREVAAQAEAKAAEAREQQLAGLVAAGNRALESDAEPEAERLFGRVVELDEDNPRAAFGLARIRLHQGNLSGAEGWIQLALRKRPKRSAYHALYAEILARLGRDDEADEERRHTAAKDSEDEPLGASPPSAPSR